MGCGIMIARVGYVLYWIGCGFAVLFLFGALAGFGILITGSSTEPRNIIAGAVSSIVVAVLCWAVGKSLRYFLAGD